MKRILGYCVAAALLGTHLLNADDALAQSNRLSSSNWRRRDRSARDDKEKPHDISTYAFELRFGPYNPAVDDNPDYSGAPYATAHNTNAQFYFGIEFDWLPLRIPYVGIAGPAIGWGITRTSKTANIAGTDIASSATDSFLIMPMHLSAVLRIDEIARRTIIPIVPYAKFGLGMGMWDISKNGETMHYLPQGAQSSILARGISWGTHLALGGMLGLGWISGRSQASLQDSLGIQEVGAFGEWMWSNLTGLGSAPPAETLYVGTSTWIIGLTFKM